MRRISWAVCFVFLLLAGTTRAVELDKIERTIGKLPKFTAERQGYCLLVIGPEARKRVWLVRDGSTLYVDRNGNGDLTEPDERVEADAKSSDLATGEFSFSAGDIPHGKDLHKDLNVSWYKLDHLRDDFPALDKTLDEDPKFCGCSVNLDVVMPDQQGAGIGGRVLQVAGAWDDRGLLEFAERPAEAPIVHFGGPWTIAMFGPPDPLRIGRKEEIMLAAGTPGVGAGSTAHVAFEKVIPAAIAPKLLITYPAVESGQPRLVETYELTERCCGINLYGDIVVPENVGAGVAQVVVSLESWPGAFVAASTYDVQVIPRPPRPKLEPISSRLAGQLDHELPRTTISGVRFSPDGKQVVAGTYPDGIINVWDVASGKRVARMDARKGGRASADYFTPSPDWKKLYAWQETGGDYTTIERDGKQISSVKYSSLIRAWDLDTGTLLRTYQSTPPHGIRSISLAPNGRYMLSFDETPGEFEGHRPRALTLWNIETGADRQLEKGNAVPQCFTSDSRLVSIHVNDDDNDSQSIKIYAVPEWKLVRTIVETAGQCSAETFAAGDRILVGTVGAMKSKNDYESMSEQLKFWDVDSGAEVLTIEPPEGQRRFVFQVASPDGQIVASTTYSPLDRKPAAETLVLVNIPQKTWKFINAPPGASTGEPVFHPSGKWLALPTQVFPRGTDFEVEEIAQPGIMIVSVPEGEILETLVAPQAVASSMAFSPDGITLATGGHGAVLLWDFHTPPGSVGR